MNFFYLNFVKMMFFFFNFLVFKREYIVIFFCGFVYFFEGGNIIRIIERSESMLRKKI